MPRRKAARHCKIVPWLSARLDSKEGRFIQIGNSLLLSEKYNALRPVTRLLYLCMAMEAGGNKSFNFPLSAAKKYGFSESSLWRGVKELESAGFLRHVSMKNLRMPNEYTFYDGWMLGG